MGKQQTVARRIMSSTEAGVAVPLIVLIVVLSLVAKNFMTGTNVFNMLRACSFEGIAAIGMLIVMITGGLDLSIASTMMFAGVISTLIMTKGIPTAPAIVLTLLICGGIGLINAFFINRIGLGSIIVTLGMLSVVRGAAYIITQGLPITDLSSDFIYLGQGMLFGAIPLPVIIFVVIAILAHFFLKYTVIGYHFYSIGGNEIAARYSGINVQRVRSIAYALCSILGGCGGILLIARLGVAQPSIAEGYELTIIAGVIIGGTSLLGGEGSVLGAIIGILIIAVITNGLVLANIGGFYIQFVNGLMILCAVALNRIRGITK